MRLAMQAVAMVAVRTREAALDPLHLMNSDKLLT